LAENSIATVANFPFRDLTSLTTLHLSTMNLEVVSLTDFISLHKLRYLNLSMNNIEILQLDGLQTDSSSSLKILDVKGNGFDFTKSAPVVPLMKHMIYIGSDDYRFCCISDILLFCDAPFMGGTDCFNIFTSLYMKTYMWIIAMFSLGTNIFVITYHALAMKQRKLHSLMLLNLALDDSIMAVYLLSIGAADFIFQGSYVLNEM